MGELIGPEVFRKHQAEANNLRCIARVRELRSECKMLTPPPTLGAKQLIEQLCSEMQQIDLLTMFLLEISGANDVLIEVSEPTPTPPGAA